MNTITNTLPVILDKFLMDFAQVTGLITYNDIMDFGERYTPEYAKPIAKLHRKIENLWEIGVENDDPELQELYKKLVTMIKCL